MAVAATTARLRPLWLKEGGYLLFSDINRNRRMKYTPAQGTVEFKKPTNGANGLTRDIQGRLVACEGAGRRVIREEQDGTVTVIAASFQDRPIPNAPDCSHHAVKNLTK
jgi:gluconolactonase